MVTKFVEIVNARIVIDALDATYAVQFDEEFHYGDAWEFDAMCDSHMKKCVKTGNIKVRFNPVLTSMSFSEDAKRPSEYVMSKENAREIFKNALAQKNYWFILDLANLAKIKN